MRILHVYRTYFPDPPGGIQEVIRQLCLATKTQGIESRVFTLSPQPDPAVVALPEASVTRARSWWAPASCDLGSGEAFAAFARAAAWADVVQIHYPWPFGDLLRLMLPSNKPCVLTYHSDIVRQRWLGMLYAPLMHYTLRKVDAVVAGSPDYAQTSTVLAQPNIAAKLQVIPYGISDQRPAYDEAAGSSIRQRLGLADQPYFLALGVFRYYKGFHSLVQAAVAVKAKIVLAGSGPENERLRAQAAALGADNVIFTGQVSDAEKWALLAGCRAFVLPSHLRSEAFGMVLVEAAMMGRPMICCSIGTGTSFINQHNLTGFVVPPETPEALSAAMNQLLQDDALTQKMGLAARERYETVFSAEQMGKAYAALYETVVARKKAA